MTTRNECLVAAAAHLANGLRVRDELIAAGRADEAARLAGCRTDQEVAAWVAEWAPDQRPAIASSA